MIWIIGAALIPFSAAVNGYVLSVLWNWFAVPALGAHSLSVLPAIGVSLVVSKLTYRMDMPTKTMGKDIAEVVIVAFLEIPLHAGIYLGMGLVVHWLMVS